MITLYIRPGGDFPVCRFIAARWQACAALSPRRNGAGGRFPIHVEVIHGGTVVVSASRAFTR